MPYAPPSFTEIRADLLDEYRGNVGGADVSSGSEIYARASVTAAGVALGMEGVKFVERQIFPDSADTANLERHAGLYDLERLAPTASTLTVRLTGTNGTAVSSGLSLVHVDGTAFLSTSGGVVASGILDVTATAVAAGASGNKSIGVALTVQSPPPGLSAAATVTVAGVDGTDSETDAALADRVLQRMRLGNAGGTQSDYEQWALSVAGVVQADCLAIRRGVGTVSVAVYSLGSSGFREPAGATLRTAVQAYLDTQRPVTCEVDTPTITEVPVDYTVVITVYEAGYDPDTVNGAVADALSAYLYGLATGEPDYLSRSGRAISAVPGVVDFTITTPTSTTSPTVSASAVEVLIPGTITVGP